MSLTIDRRRCTLALLALAASTGVQAKEQALTIVVPYAAGGPLDKSARVLAESAQAKLGPVQVDNRPGAGGNLGAAQVAKAAAGEPLLLMGAVATHAINPWLQKDFPYDPLRDFKPLLLVARTPNVLVMSATQAETLGIRNAKDLVRYLQAPRGEVRYGSGGNGSIGHIAGEMFKSLSSTQMTHQPFAGAGPALKALQEGQVLLMFDNLASSLPLIREGKLRALGVTTLAPDPSLPEVPSINSQVPGFNVSTWFGLFAPANLPEAQARAYATAFTAAMHTPAGRQQFKAMGLTPEDMTLDAFDSFVRSEHKKYGFLIKAVQIRPQ